MTAHGIMTQVDFGALTGLKTLTAVDYDAEWDDEKYEDASVIRFVLNGDTYIAVENPSDGYRSSLGYFYKDNRQRPTNKFDPVKVFVMLRPDNDRKGLSYHILDVVDVQSGLVVLSVGTDLSDSYYPSFVGNWSPENLYVNQKRG